MKKKLGIIGGMGSRASSLFLKSIIDYSPALSDQDFIEILMHNNSSIPDRTKAIVNDECSPVPQILKSVKIFNENAVNVIVMVCITSYHFFEEIAPLTSAKFINPVSLVGNRIRKNYSGVKKVGLLATTGTIKSGLFQKELQEHDVEVITLNDADQEKYFMGSVYMKNGLKSAVISESSKSLLLKTVPILEGRGAELIIGGCSEIPIVLNSNNLSIPFIDSIDLLAKETVNYCYNIQEIQ